MKTALLASLMVVGGLGFGRLQDPAAQEEERPKVTAEKPMSFWMAKKLDYSKQILEGMTMGDFQAIAQAGRRMKQLGLLEEFVRGSHPEYRAHLHTFEFSNQTLIHQAERQNLEGATLAFNHMMSSCVACHATLRNPSPQEK